MVVCVLGACAKTDTSRTGASANFEAPTDLVAAARDTIRAKCPDAASHPVVMTGSPSAYARYNYVDGTIELTTSWEAKASKEVSWGGKVIAHEWAHSLQDPYFSITTEGEAEASARGNTCV